MPATTYSFLEVVAAISGPGGVINLGSGAGAAKEGITVDAVADIDSMVIGADGSGMHSLVADKSARATIRLLKTSPANQLLSLMAAFQRSSAAQFGQNTISIVDQARGDVLTLRQVAFARIPSINYGSEAGMIEWTFNAVTFDLALGGI